MSDEDLLQLLLMAGLAGLLAATVIAFIAGNIISELFSAYPPIAGPLGAGIALIVFVYIVGKLLSLFFN